MSVNLSLFAGAGWQFFDNNGVPLAGGLLYTYAAGTTTPQTTYTTSAGNIANSNPIVLDSAGRVPNEIWLTSTLLYKFLLKTSVGTQIASYDNIAPAADSASLAASGGSALVGYIGGGSGAVATTVQAKLRQSVSVFDFMTAAQIAAVQAHTANDVTAAIQACWSYCTDNGFEAFHPDGWYTITSQLVWNGAGSIVSESAGSVIYPTGTGYTAVLINGTLTRCSLYLNGANNTLNGIQIGSETDVMILSRFEYLSAVDFDGFAIKVIDTFDCTFDSINITGSGNASTYAFYVTNSTGNTTNECVFNHIQVETAIQKAIYINPNTFHCVFNHIHNERINSTTTTQASVFGGQSCTYNAIRCDFLTASNGTVYFENSGCTITNFRCETNNDVLVNAATSSLPVTFITPITTGKFTVNVNSTGSVSIVNSYCNELNLGNAGKTVVTGGYAGTLTLQFQPSASNANAFNTQFYGTNIGTLTRDSAFACGVFNGCTIAALGSILGYMIANNTTIAGSATWSDIGIEWDGVTYTGNVTLAGTTAISPSIKNSTIVGNLVGGATNNCRIVNTTVSGTVTAIFNAAPNSGAFQKGARHDIITAASGSPSGWRYSGSAWIADANAT